MAKQEQTTKAPVVQKNPTMNPTTATSTKRKRNNRRRKPETSKQQEVLETKITEKVSEPIDIVMMDGSEATLTTAEFPSNVGLNKEQPVVKVKYNKNKQTRKLNSSVIVAGIVFLLSIIVLVFMPEILKSVSVWTAFGLLVISGGFLMHKRKRNAIFVQKNEN